VKEVGDVANGARPEAAVADDGLTPSESANKLVQQATPAPDTGLSSLIHRHAARSVRLLDIEEQRNWVEQLDLDNTAKPFLENVWLRYIAWWDERARQARRRYHLWRGIVLIGGAATPSLISFSIGGQNVESLQWAAWGTGLLVAVAAALESLFGWGDIWREKRAAGELLKLEGWRFFQLTDRYRGMTHAEAFPDFVEAVDRLIEHEIGEYLAAAVPHPLGGEGSQDGTGKQKDKDPTTPDPTGE
jgi:hypothetical protein